MLHETMVELLQRFDARVEPRFGGTTSGISGFPLTRTHWRADLQGSVLLWEFRLSTGHVARLEGRAPNGKRLSTGRRPLTPRDFLQFALAKRVLLPSLGVWVCYGPDWKRDWRVTARLCRPLRRGGLRNLGRSEDPVALRMAEEVFSGACPPEVLADYLQDVCAPTLRA